jgi:uncharacterized protein YndB with AHSA1/START domain
MLKSESLCLLIADISGYTSYLAGVELDHAQDILADLVGTVVTSLQPTFGLAKLEGDAAFMAAPLARLDGSLVLDSVERCYFGFRRRRRDVRQATSCECDACTRIPDLDLKFVVHTGPAIRQQVAGSEELIGPAVIVVHRLLKNDVVERTGLGAYALLSQTACEALGIEPELLGMTAHAETYDAVGDIPSWVHDLERRWAEEDDRTRVIVSPEDAMFSVEADVSAPPQVVWEFLTTPGRRVEWQPGVLDVTTTATGNRRTVGATNHCMHGEDATVEEILDWRPFDYYPNRSTMGTPVGPVHGLSTAELEPTSNGTHVALRFAAPEDPGEQAILAEMGPIFQEILDENGRRLKEVVGREFAERAREAAPVA